MSVSLIMNNSIFAVKTGKGRRNHKKKSTRINTKGGSNVVKNQWSTTPHGTKASTVIRDKSQVEFEVTISKQKVVLFDESTYSPAMIAEKELKPVKNKGVSTHKVTKAYTMKAPTNGRRVIK